MLRQISSHTIDESLLGSRPTVLDVGSRNYGFAKGILDIRPEARIICIEPDPTVPATDNPKITLIRRAVVGLPRESAPYCHYSTGEGNYLQINDWFHPNKGETMTVPCITLAKVFDWFKLESISLIKLDCEGEEFSILENLPNAPLAMQISVEFHDFTSRDRHDDAYYQRLFNTLNQYVVRQHDLSPVGPGKVLGHWDSLLTLI